jgi:alanyl-tRNA synthetase
VLACEKRGENEYSVVLDKTAFFPDEGGQSCDGGTIDGKDVKFVAERDGVIYHTLTQPVEVGIEVKGSIDFDARFRKMQNHTGEHIISGLIHTHYGYNNVGFHLGEDDVTADFDGELSAQDIKKIEELANAVVFACRNVRAYYPSRDELSGLKYRSKLDITDGVRIVEIDGVDKCACCAPHVHNTGEVGLIKILDFIRYKGGMRIHIQCGYDALDDYRERYEQVRAVSMAISAKQGEIGEGVNRLLDELGRQKGVISALRREIMQYKLDALQKSDGSICIFDDCEDALALRNFVNEAVKKTDRICAVFSGNDIDGYKYIIASEHIKLRGILPTVNERLCGRGGGSDVMIQGSCTANRANIEALFEGDEW